MSTVDFKGVEDTLFIPLAARVLASNRFPNFFYDEKSLEFKSLPQVLAVNEKSSEYTMLASVSRYYCVDNMVKAFIEKNPGASIVSLGVGLETMSYRLTDTSAHFYQIDFPQVIQSRKKLLGEAKNETLIECDITDLDWTKHIDKNKPILLVASGVFQYFKSEEVSAFLGSMKKSFTNAELIFDASDKTGIKYAQKYVKKTGNQSAMMYFFINDAKAFCQKEHIVLIAERGFFAEAQMQLKGLKLYTKIAMKVVEDKKRVLLLHVKL